MKVLFEDKWILVLDKPPGLVVDKSDTQTADTLEDWLASQGSTLERGGIVHRLDKDTSGVILVAKTQSALEKLQAQFKERKTKKEYLSLVHGEVSEGGVIEGEIGRNPKNREKFIVMEQNPRYHRISTSEVGYREAVTEYEPIKLLVMSYEFVEKIFHGFNKIQFRKLRTMKYQLFTLLAVKPKTGRTHQIRVHLKYIGHPIISDEKYGGRKMARLDKRWCPRIFLHAKSLGFYHPKSGEWMEVESKLAEDLKGALNNLKS